MTRKEKVLKHIDKCGYGLEVGPSHNPLAPKCEGYSVQIIDHMSRKQLIEKYTNDNVRLENIEDVDFVWNGESYTDLTGKKKHYDWIIASHLIEHTPDLIGFLNDCDQVLKDDGVLSLVIPDKRYCFDHYRPITGISKIIDASFNKNKTHTIGTAAEGILMFVKLDGTIAWDKNTIGEYSRPHSRDAMLKLFNEAIKNTNYEDAHAWCFVPHSFRLLIQDLFMLGLIPFQEVDFYDTEGFEFCITLGRGGKGCSIPRLKLFAIIESELNVKKHRLKYFLRQAKLLLVTLWHGLIGTG
jgi:SAM-dependent methyltransferase